MASFKPKDIVKILQKLGFLRKRQTGNHIIMYNPNSKKIVPEPIHNKDIGKGLVQTMIKQADSTEEEFIKLKWVSKNSHGSTLKW